MTQLVRHFGATSEDYTERVAVFLRLWRPDAGFAVADLDGRGVLSTVRAAADVLLGLRCGAW